MSSDITIIIPFLDEEKNAERLASELNLFTSSNNKISFEILFVDDGSTDNTIEILSKFPFNSDVKIIKFSKNFGAHAALRAGIQYSTGEFITFSYADLQDPLDLILRMYEICKKGNDIVWAVRNSANAGFFEKVFSMGYAKLLKIFVNPDFPKNGFDIAMFNSKIKNELNKNVETNSSVFLQILNLGFNQEFIYYDKQERQAGVSNWTLSKKFKLFIDSFVAFSYAPIRMVTIIGISFFFLGIIWTIYIIFREIFFHDLTPGWPALVSILMIGFGISNISLGIIAEYLWRTLDASRKRPVFIIDDVIIVKDKESENKI